MMDRLRNLPMWFRLFLAALPILICIPLACIVVVLYQQYASLGPNVTATAQAVETEAALALTQAAGQDSLALTQAAGDAQLAQTASALSALTAGETATAEANTQNQAAAQTQTAEAGAQVEVTDTPAEAAPTDTAAPTEEATRPAIRRTATPTTVTVTLRECRGLEGTVLFGQALPQSLHSFSSVTFTVAPGTYHLHIEWFQQPKFNVDSDVEIKTSQTIAFGDQCQ